VALRADGTVTAWGNDMFSQATPPAGLTSVVAIAAGDNHSLALKSDGTVVGWGSLGSVTPQDLYGVVGIAAGFQHSLAIRSDGTVFRWPGSSGPNRAPVHATNVVGLDTGFEASVAVRQDGYVVTWGGLLNPGGIFPPGPDGIAAVTVGRNYVLYLRTDGTVVGPYVPEGLSDVVAIAAGGDRYGMALKSDGTVVTWNGPEVPPDLENVTAISAGGSIGTRSFGLVITTAPPLPRLAAKLAAIGRVEISASVSVPGYILEGSANPTQPFAVIPSYTNSFRFTNSDVDGIVVPADNTLRFFRLRKQ